MKNYTGKKNGMLTVIKPTGKRTESGNILWLVKCSCGVKKELVPCKILGGRIKSCGCLALKKQCLGKTFGRLLVLKSLGTNGSNMTIWLCRCKCGKKTKVLSGNLLAGRTRSCGCLEKEARPYCTKRNAKKLIAAIV